MTLPELLGYAGAVLGGLAAGAGGLHGLRRRRQSVTGAAGADDPPADGQQLRALWRAYHGQRKVLDSMAGDVRTCVGLVRAIEGDIAGLREWRAAVAVRLDRAEDDIASLRRGRGGGAP